MLAYRMRTIVSAGGFSREFGARLAHVAFWPGACLVILLQFSFPAFAQFQTGPRSKLPVIDKITSSGPTRAALTGKIQSLDTKLKVLDISEGQGRSLVIFPLNKKVKVSSISGHKLKLAALTPGTNVVVYYQQRDARRTIQQIVILGSSASQTPKSPHSS
jgi:hypothetical protein